MRLKQMMRPVGVPAIAVAGVGCGGDDDSTSTPAAKGGEKKAKIAYLTAALQNVYTAAALKGMKEVAAKRNASLKVFDANYDAQKQGSQIQDAVTAGGYDAFIILPVNGTIVPEVKQAVKAGIPVVSHDLPLGNDTGSQVQVPGVLASVMEDLPVTPSQRSNVGRALTACTPIWSSRGSSLSLLSRSCSRRACSRAWTAASCARRRETRGGRTATKDRGPSVQHGLPGRPTDW